MIRETYGHLRDLPRYRQILTTLVVYGYRDVVSALRLDGLVRPIEKAAFGEDTPPKDRPMRLRLVCEALGPTFVKLGQLLSTRPDLLPQAYVTELSKLRDDVKPFPFCEVEAILREEFGREPLELFDEIDPKPVASASISQVHRAKTHTGEDVALKVRRPGIEKTIHADLEIIKNLSQLAERRMPNLAGFGTVAIAKELERSLKRELDLEIELRTIERCRKQMSHEKNVHILKTYKELSTQRVLAMEYVNGLGVGDLDGIRKKGLEPKEVAARGAKVFLTQIFIYGFFHADPHSGNLRIGSDGVIVPLDYGLFGHLDARTRERIADLIWGLVSQDVDRILGALEALGIQGDSEVSSAMRRDLAEIVAAYSDLSLETIDLSQLLRELVSLVSEHRLKIPPDLVLLIRAHNDRKRRQRFGSALRHRQARQAVLEKDLGAKALAQAIGLKNSADHGGSATRLDSFAGSASPCDWLDRTRRIPRPLRRPAFRKLGAAVDARRQYAGGRSGGGWAYRRVVDHRPFERWTQSSGLSGILRCAHHGRVAVLEDEQSNVKRQCRGASSGRVC